MLLFEWQSMASLPVKPDEMDPRWDKGSQPCRWDLVRGWAEAAANAVLGCVAGFTDRADRLRYLLRSADYSFSPLPLFFD